MRRKIHNREGQSGQEGYMLLAVMFLVTLMLVALAVELPRISQQIKRDKEDELVRRGKEYATAIKKFYHKNGTYPLSLEQLENTNHFRFLRQRYKDPMTTDGEWRLIHVGEAQINIPAPRNIPGTGLPGSSASPSPTPAGSAGAAGPGLSTSGGVAGPGLSPGAPGGQLGSLTPSAGMPTQGGGPIIGVASNSKKTSIKEFNGDSEYDRWLFVYDPRVEQALQGGGVIIASPRSANSPAGGAPSSGTQAPQSASPSTTPTPSQRLPQ
jgi:type II secretory pathway pseudopilin PulG